MRDMFSPARVGDALRQIRKRRGMNQSDLARGAHVGTSTISRVEAGESYPRGDILFAVLEHLGPGALGELAAELEERGAPAMMVAEGPGSYNASSRRVSLDEAITRLSRLLDDACQQRDDYRRRWEQAREELSAVTAKDRAAEAEELDAMAERAARIVAERQAQRRTQELRQEEDPQPAAPAGRR